MLIDFNAIKEITVPGMNGGTGTMSAKMYMGEQGKIIPCSIHPGGSIGLHRHKTSDDINYVLSAPAGPFATVRRNCCAQAPVIFEKRALNTASPIPVMRIWC